jgi:hypothetical protein
MNRRSYGLKRYNKYGGKLTIPIVYTQEKILEQIYKYKTNKSYFANYRPNPQNGEYGLDNIKTKNHNFYENNLCVFAEFDSEYDVSRMYLGKMTSSADELENFLQDRNNSNRSKLLSFQCDLLTNYHSPYSLQEYSFSKEFKLDGRPEYGVLIGFLKIEYKESVLHKAREIKQSYKK